VNVQIDLVLVAVFFMVWGTTCNTCKMRKDIEEIRKIAKEQVDKKVEIK